MSIILSEEVTLLESSTKKGKDGKWFIEGIFLQGNIKNRNNRVYPMDVLDEAVGKFDSEYIKKNRALGELGHPEGRHRPKQDEAVIKIVSLVKEGSNYIGKAKVLNTHAGKNLQALLEDEVNIGGVSSRALGTLRESNGVNVVQGDLEFFAIDVVSDPSAPDAWVNAIMEEKEAIYCPNGQCYILAEEIKNKINKTSKKDLEKVILESWKQYCKKLKL